MHSLLDFFFFFFAIKRHTDGSLWFPLHFVVAFPFPTISLQFRYKTDTDLYALAKAKTTAPSLEVCLLSPVSIKVSVLVTRAFFTP